MRIDDFTYHLLEELKAGRINRRELLRIASVMGLSTAGLVLPKDRAAQGQTPMQPKRGGTLKVSMRVPTASPDPVTMYDSGGIETVEVAGEFLCFPRPDYTLQPKLATKWYSDSSGKTWTFELRKGVRFHDGSPMTADDVIATFERLINPKSNSAARSAFEGLLAAGQTEKLSETTIRFHLQRPYVDFPYIVSTFNYNTIILPRNYQPGDFIKGKVGTGPYILTSYAPQQSATFVRNPNYWNPNLPYLDGIQVTYFASDSSAVLAMESGSVDILPEAEHPVADPLLRNPRVTILSDGSSQTSIMHFRVDQPPFTDKRVRQALALSLDRKAIIESLFQGRGAQGDDHVFAPIYPTSPAPGTVPARNQDYAKAKALLAAAGHPNGINVALTTEQFREIPQWAVLTKGQCEPAGIKVDLNIETQAAYYGSGNNQPWLDTPFGITDWGERGSPAQLTQLAFRCGGVWDSAHWCNPDFDKLMEQFESTLDLQARKRIAADAARLMQDETPGVIAYWIEQSRATSKSVHGFANGPTFPVDFSGVWMG
jgi:peptide/nickel transport system substrate-binding protein